VQPFKFDNTDTPTQVAYNGNQTGFAIKTGENSTMTVGFSGQDVFESQTVTIDSTNQNLDFKENGGAELTATIPAGTYTGSDLAQLVQNAMDTASAKGGIGATYHVSYDTDTKKFSIDDGGGANFQLLWNSGTHKDTNIGAEMGFNVSDESGANTYTSDNAAQWGIFNTLFNLRDALQNNDTAGISKSLSKLDDAANQMDNIISQIGYKGSALQAKTNIISDLNLSETKQQSTIQDADVVSAITNLQSKQIAYQAALASSSQIMKLSLVNYM
jgi:flagellar hook-associated protein 3 FlgL